MLELCCQSLQVQSFLQLWRLREACRTHDRLEVLLPFLQRFQIGQPNPRRGDFGIVSPIAAGPVFFAAVAPEGGAQDPRCCECTGNLYACRSAKVSAGV